MARLPNKIVYKFYGLGIPESRAVKFLTVCLRSQRCSIEKGSLVISLTGRKQRHIGILPLKLLCWIHSFGNAKHHWFDTVEEAWTDW